MNLEIYFDKIEKLSQTILKENKATHDYLEKLANESDHQLVELIDFRKGFIDSKEFEKVSPYLVTGFFKVFTGLERIACFVLTFEIDEIRTIRSWEKRCEHYSLNHPLFEREPSLYDKIRKKNSDSCDLELIDFNVFENINGSEILKYNKSYTILEHILNPSIVYWAASTFIGKPLFVRVNPYLVYDKKPRQVLYESILIPANPHWWKELTIHNNGKESAAYVLCNCQPKENPMQFWEYNIKNIRRLEVIAKRNNQGNLSMMIEEITDIDTNGIVYGRMIHLDTDNEYGTEFEHVMLNHLDLAINIYEGNRGKCRLNDSLAKGGKITDASFRTHLLRIEGIPFKSVIGFVLAFFRSQTLINEWIEDQFSELNRQSKVFKFS